MKKISKYILASMVVLGAAIAPMVSSVGVEATENLNKASTGINVTINNGGGLKFDSSVTNTLEFATEYTFKEYLDFTEDDTSILQADSENKSFELKFTDDRFSAKGYEISAQITESNLSSPELKLKSEEIRQNAEEDKIKYDFSPRSVNEENVFTINGTAAPVINATRKNAEKKYFGAGSWIAKFGVTELLFSSSSLTPENDKYLATITWTLADIASDGNTPE